MPRSRKPRCASDSSKPPISSCRFRRAPSEIRPQGVGNLSQSTSKTVGLGPGQNISGIGPYTTQPAGSPLSVFLKTSGPLDRDPILVKKQTAVRLEAP